MEYICKLKVTELPESGYQVKFDMNNSDKPLVIAAQVDAEQFLKYIEQEIKSRSLWKVEYSLGYQSFPDSCDDKPKVT